MMNGDFKLSLSHHKTIFELIYVLTESQYVNSHSLVLWYNLGGKITPRHYGNLFLTLWKDYRAANINAN